MKLFFTSFIFLFSCVSLFAQTIYTRTDTIPVTEDSVTFKAGEFYGEIQWQHSLNGTTWENLSGSTDTLLKIAADDQGFYRAEITDGTCNPVYSDTSAVVLDGTKSANIVDPDKIEGACYIGRNDSIFIFSTTSDNAISINSVFVDSDSVSDIRVVTGVIQNNDTITVTTSPGTMEDLFVNQEFSLSTQVLEAGSKSTYTTKEALMNSLIDKKGVIHPYRVIDNNTALKSSGANNESLPAVNFNYDFSGLELWKNGGASIFVSEGYFNLGTELNYDFKFESSKLDWSQLKLPKGKLTAFKIYTKEENTGIDSKIILTASLDSKYSFDEEIAIKEGIFNKSFFYFIPPYYIPFSANVKIDLMARAEGNFESAVSISGGASGAAHFRIGASYENGNWNKIQSSSSSINLEGPTIDGHLNMEHRVEVYPRVEIEFYSFVAPYLEIVPYVEDEMECSLKGNFNYGLYSGVDARVGVDVNVLGENIANCSFPKSELKRDTLYKLPAKLELVSGGNQTGEPGDTLAESIVFKVTDSKNEVIKNCLVNFFTEFGNVFGTNSNSNKSSVTSKSFLLDEDDITYSDTTDAEGQISVRWQLAEAEEIKDSLKAYLRNGDDSINKETIVSVSSECGCDTSKFEYFIDPRDGHVYKTIEIGEQVWMAENLAYAPFVNSLNDSSSIYPRCYAHNPAYYAGYLNSQFGYYPYSSAYGILYNRPAAVIACPVGWHLPSDEEWAVMIQELGGSKIAGGKMKSPDLWYNPNSSYSYNSSCFSALPGGQYSEPTSSKESGAIVLVGFVTGFWSSTIPIVEENNAYKGWVKTLTYSGFGDLGIGYSSIGSSNGLSEAIEIASRKGWYVRCVKDL